MKKLSARLSQELVKLGNLPISAEGIRKLRPEIASTLEDAETVLRTEIEHGQTEGNPAEIDGRDDDFLIARFVAGSEENTHLHLFMMEAPQSKNQGKGLKRWSKRPVSYGSFVQIQKFLKEAWGEARNLEIERVQLLLDRSR